MALNAEVTNSNVAPRAQRAEAAGSRRAKANRLFLGGAFPREVGVYGRSIFDGGGVRHWHYVVRGADKCSRVLGLAPGTLNSILKQSGLKK